jgi:hypothetical protein
LEDDVEGIDVPHSEQAKLRERVNPCRYEIDSNTLWKFLVGALEPLLDLQLRRTCLHRLVRDLDFVDRTRPHACNYTVVAYAQALNVAVRRLYRLLDVHVLSQAVDFESFQRFDVRLGFNKKSP